MPGAKSCATPARPGCPPTGRPPTTCATHCPTSRPAAPLTWTARAPRCWPCWATTCATRCSPSRWPPRCCPRRIPGPAWANASGIPAAGCNG
ncbi:hypothetical protein G6F55_014186 [Rhizopus delemar]|nr:hypothetical protein G6F55_014186 [Rhizopus delemar]